MSELRGLPLVGRGMTGAIPGTDPMRALLAKENREARKRRQHARNLAISEARRRKRRRRRKP